MQEVLLIFVVFNHYLPAILSHALGHLYPQKAGANAEF